VARVSHVEPSPSAAPVSTETTAATPERRIERARKRAVPARPVDDLRDQIALIDAARTAVKAGSTERALVLLRRYDTNYPGGAFRPEALALRIEALAAGGRGAEARALAREFLARYPQSPLADRVERVAR
jgi:outer membrane protein assembly factor BamD (BamD/ComL family)